jgi:hypothetical protein
VVSVVLRPANVEEESGFSAYSLLSSGKEEVRFATTKPVKQNHQCTR